MPQSLSLLELSLRLGFAFVAAVSALVVWARNREPSWLWVILGAVFLYLDQLAALLVHLGVLPIDLFEVQGVPLTSWILLAAACLCLTAGFWHRVWVWGRERASLDNRSGKR